MRDAGRAGFSRAARGQLLPSESEAEDEGAMIQTQVKKLIQTLFDTFPFGISTQFTGP